MRKLPLVRGVLGEHRCEIIGVKFRAGSLSN